MNDWGQQSHLPNPIGPDPQSPVPAPDSPSWTPAAPGGFELPLDPPAPEPVTNAPALVQWSPPEPSLGSAPDAVPVPAAGCPNPPESVALGGQDAGAAFLDRADATVMPGEYSSADVTIDGSPYDAVAFPYALPDDMNWVPPYDGAAALADDLSTGAASSYTDPRSAFNLDLVDALAAWLPQGDLIWVSPWDDGSGSTAPAPASAYLDLAALVPVDTSAPASDGGVGAQGGGLQSGEPDVKPAQPADGGSSSHWSTGRHAVANGEFQYTDPGGNVITLSHSYDPSVGTTTIRIGDDVIVVHCPPAEISVQLRDSNDPAKLGVVVVTVPAGTAVEGGGRWALSVVHVHPEQPPIEFPKHQPPSSNAPAESRAPDQPSPGAPPTPPVETPAPSSPQPAETPPGRPSPTDQGQDQAAQPEQPPPMPPLPVPDVVSAASPLPAHDSAMPASGAAQRTGTTGMEGVQQRFAGLPSPSPAQLSALQSLEPSLFVDPEVQQLLADLSDALIATGAVNDREHVGLSHDDRGLVRRLGREARTLPANIFHARYGISPRHVGIIELGAAALDRREEQRMAQLAEARNARMACAPERQVRFEARPPGPNDRPVPALDRDERLRLLQKRVAADADAIRNSVWFGNAAMAGAMLAGHDPAAAARDVAPADGILTALAGIGAGRQQIQSVISTPENNPGSEGMLGGVANGRGIASSSDEEPRSTGSDTLVGASRDAMRRDAARLIAGTPNHPLAFLLDASGRFKSSRGLPHSELANRPDLVQMGHLTSAKSGAPERIVLQGAWENQFDNVTLEHPARGGAVLQNEAVDIGGVAVELRTARFWESIGWLSSGTVAAAPRLF